MPTLLEITDHETVRQIRLARPPANALSPELMVELDTELNTALDAAATRGGAVVISGGANIFSAGLDVPALLELDRPALEVAWATFLSVVRKIATSPVPIAFAITGHATAGGCVLPIYGDARFMTRGRVGKDGGFQEFRIGVNEVQVGLPMPSVIIPALARIVGARQAERMCVSAELLAASEAHRIGLVDELLDSAEATVERALAWSRAVANHPPTALALTRAAVRADLHAAVEAAAAIDQKNFIDDWFSPEAQGALRALVARLAKK